ncbi:hypothetical protein [Spirosoma rhododendri]|uniref:Outer membrane beta-barrel protein n=1 Tax=Spirosoma rhododendri TaxID=2728024 RepID=A0A7L5DPN1_9BACT|nr:hypothetical protein [Spirosoma rhododendri]QJD77987.1 hypothetical protein HH216_05795 [Spirosoma rhododendri]
MKTGKRIGIVGLACLIATAARAQQWTFGPKLELGLSARSTSAGEVTIGDVSVESGSNAGDALGAGIGGFARYDRSRWYGQAELLTQRANVANYYISGPRSGFSEYARVSRFAGRVLGGYKPLPWLRFTVGVAANQYRRNQEDQYAPSIASYYRLADMYPAYKDEYLASVRTYEVAQSVNSSFKKVSVDVLAGVGVDVGGLTIDIMNSSSLTPVVDGITHQGQVYDLRQKYSNWSLQLGYRLFPVKAHLLAPRRSNRAYERIKKDIPFYRNEVHIAGGLLGEDIGSAFLYENRYTRYLTRRVGLSVGANIMRLSKGYLPGQTTEVQLLPAVRFLPLYSRRHIIGLSTGPLLRYESGYRIFSGRSGANGPTTVNLRNDSGARTFSAGIQGTVDYQFAISDRLLVGPWLRLSSDYAYAGIQAGYRF